MIQRKPKFIPAFGPIGETVAQRSYLKPKKLSLYHHCSDEAVEKWEELCYRVTMGNMDFVPKAYNQPEAQALYQALLSMEILLGGRHLCNTGIKNREFIGNCYVSLWKWSVPSKHFTFSFEREMEGGGMGCNYSDSYFLNAPNMKLQKYKFLCKESHPDMEEMKLLGAETLKIEKVPETDLQFRPKGGEIQYHEVGDSREGWSEAIAVLIDSIVAKKDLTIVFDFSKVREKGAELKSIGGQASGPAPLLKTIQQIIQYVREHDGGKFDWEAGYNFDHWVAECVMAGGFRRVARMSMKYWGDPGIMKFIQSKQDGFSQWTTNISVIVDHLFFKALASGDKLAVMVWEGVIDGMYLNGEPGFANWDLLNVGEPEEVFSLNACVTGDTHILMEKGSDIIKNLIDKEVKVWNGYEYSSVTPKFTGRKQCYMVTLSNRGILECSWNHEFILEDGSRIKTNKLTEGMKLKVFAAKAGVLPPDKHGTIVVERVAKKGIRNTYCFNEPLVHQGTFNGVVTGQCGEFGLRPGEFCNTGHLNLARISDDLEVHRLAKLCTRALMRANFSQLNHISKQITEKNQRIGCGIMGLQQFSCAKGIKYTEIAGSSVMRRFFTQLYKTVRKEADEYAEFLGCAKPIKVTTIAPTGSVGQVAGATTGCQCIIYKRYIRRIRFQEGNPVLAAYREAGYTIEVDEMEKRLGRIVCVPMVDPIMDQFPESLIEDQTEVTIEQGLALQAFLQEVWTDNSISFTVNFDPSKYTKEQLSDAIKKYLPKLKGTTVLTEKHNFKQPPYSPLTKEEYAVEISKLKKVIHGKTGEIERSCASGSCEVIL